MINISLEMAQSLLLRAVQTQGYDFVYAPNREMCYYLPRSEANAPESQRKTGCLIGTALKLAGVDTLKLATAGVVFTMKGRHGELGFRLTEEAAAYFAIAQAAQDHGSTWGQAYYAAEAYAHVATQKGSW